MDKREMEKLMDKYKAEMLEFSRRNNMSGYPDSLGSTNDTRERAMKEALENQGTFERDRRDPLPENKPNDENERVAVPAQVNMPQQETMPANENTSVNAAQILRENCARISANATPEQRARCREITIFFRKTMKAERSELKLLHPTEHSVSAVQE